MQLYNKINLESLQIPNDFERVNAKELKETTGFGKGYIGYRFWNGCASGLVVCSEGKKKAMPYTEQELIEDWHESMPEHAGIIEAKQGLTAAGLHYIYLLTKEREDDDPWSPEEVAYKMQMCISKNNRYLYVDSMFVEEGMTGVRGGAVFDTFREEHSDVELYKLMERWTRDPYDPEYRIGFLMNRSEARELDELFPHHPLSIARKLADDIVTLN